MAPAPIAVVRRKSLLASRSALSIPIIVFATLFASNSIAASGTARDLLASNIDPSAAKACHRAEDVSTALFPKQDVVTYDFAGETAAKLDGVMAAVVEQAVPTAALVRLVVVPGTDRALAFLFDPDGCHLVTIDLDLASMAAVFQTAGVPAPFDKRLARLNGAAI